MSYEAIFAEYYRRYHPMARPKITWGQFAYKVGAVLFISALISFALTLAQTTWSIFACELTPKKLFLTTYLFLVCGICLIFNKTILIAIIELYQHYASEKKRRKCICMPSCSVYATMAIKKYNTLKAIYLIIKRLSNCCGSIGIIDYP